MTERRRLIARAGNALKGAANAQWQLDRRRGEAARRLSQERGERSRAVGAGGGVIFATEDCRATYERLPAKGVEFTQEPTERFYRTDCALRDPIGNPLRFTQPPDRPGIAPSAEELQAQS